MIDFFRGKRDYYKREHYEGIYFATDTNEILHNGESYSGILEEGKSVEDITLENGVLTIIYTDKTRTTIEIENNKYQSNINDKSVSMTTTYGDFTIGTKVSALEGKTYDELFDGILFPSVNPTSSGTPAVSGFTLASNGPVELGTDVISISEANLDRKKWNTYNNNAPYAGEVTEVVYTFTINGTTYDEISDLENLTYELLGNHTYKVVVKYTKGIEPVNNKGVTIASLACPAGLKEATRTVNVTAPWYATTQTAGTLTKQSLISWNTTAGNMQAGADGVGFTLKAHTVTDPQIFKLPRKATKLQELNTLSGQFVNKGVPTSCNWLETSASETINGVTHTYYTYTYNGSNRGEAVLIVNF